MKDKQGKYMSHDLGLLKLVQRVRNFVNQQTLVYREVFLEIKRNEV